MYGYPMITLLIDEEYQLKYSHNPSFATKIFSDLEQFVFYEGGSVVGLPSCISITEDGLIKGVKTGLVGIQPTGLIFKASNTGRIYINVISECTESEYNDEMSYADVIKKGAKMRFNISNSNDIDIFKFTAPDTANGYFEIKLTYEGDLGTPNGKDKHLRWEMYNANTELFGSGDLSFKSEGSSLSISNKWLNTEKGYVRFYIKDYWQSYPSTIPTGDFIVEFIKVNHSIPDAVALAIKTDAGVIVQTGDFKIDTSPIDGGIIDLSRFAELGTQGVLCLLSDSTNAEQPGYSQSESKVGESFMNLFTQAGNKRIIIATFASNLHRVQQIIDIASQRGRKVALSGRSLENAVSIASELGYLDVPAGTLISIDEVRNYTDEQLVIVTTGSQGEPMSALSRMASRNHRKVSIDNNDCVIISAKPIPGNEKTVYRVINDLMKLGATVIYEKMYDVHVSGHACQEELKLMLSLVKPKYFIPVHGEQKHLRSHGRLAESIGMDPNNIIIADNGYEVSVSEKGIYVSGTVASGKVYVDGYGVGDVGTRVMKERLHLGQDGIIIVTASIDAASGELLSGPEVVSKGFVYVKEAEFLMNEAVALAMNVIDSFPPYSFDLNAMNSKIRDEISRLMYERTKRNPMILPILMEV
jgi:ribonuclease J